MVPEAHESFDGLQTYLSYGMGDCVPQERFDKQDIQGSAQTGERLRIAVLMTCHNRVEKTILSLEDLFAAAKGVADVAVFLVDDGSSDGTGARVRSQFPQVKVIDADGSLYWAKGMRLSWETAVKNGGKCDYFLWLNDDVKLKRDSLVGLLADAEQCGDTRGVIVGTCSEDESEAASSYGATDKNDVRYFPSVQVPQKAEGWFNGNVALIPWAAYEVVGMISGDYSHARADYDYAERLKRAGIPFFASSRFVGVCHNDYLKKLSGKSLWQRIQMFGKPGYWNLADLFRFRCRYWGLTRALLSACHLAFQVVFTPPRDEH